MKQILLLLMFVPITAFGQFSKGTKFTGGTMSYSSFKTDAGVYSPPSTYFSFDGRFGLFLTESFALGLAVNGVSDKLPTINPVTNLFEYRKNKGLSGGIFARKFFPVSERFLFSLEGSGLVGKAKGNFLPLQGDDSSARYQFALRPAFTFMPNNRWGFDANVGEILYHVNWSTFVYDSKNFHANLGRITLGVNYFICKKDGG